MRIVRILAALLAAVITASSFAQQKIVLGKLGQTTAATRIYAAPTSHSRIYYRAPAYEYLVLRPSKSTGWYKVLLQNGADGYVSAEKVAELPYQVTSAASRTSRNGSYSGAPSRSGAAVANYAYQFIGTPYKWGGNDPSRGIDCSGLVKNVMGKIAHVDLPRTAAEQVNVGQPITRLEDLQAGDRLYFWSSKKGKIGHTGIYLGNGYFIHASSGHGQVATDFLGTKYWLNMLVAARR
jgi:cell wall-associated NlpC family hydrolase